MKRACSAVALVLSLLCSGAASAAEVGRLLPIKVATTLTAGQPYTFRFSLFTAGAVGTGVEVWAERRAYVVPSTKLVSHVLGSVVPFSLGMSVVTPGVPAVPVDFSQQLWVQVKGGTFVKRIKLTASPYALWSSVADSLGIVCSSGQVLVFQEDGTWGCGTIAGGAVCVDGDLLPCYFGPAGTVNVGECAPGLRPCASGAWGECAGEKWPQVEVCDGRDNDCNPASADGASDPQLGVACDGEDSDLCLEGTKSCAGGALDCSDQTSDTLDVCDGVDNDCNPATEDGQFDPLANQPCDGPDADLCEEGTWFCEEGDTLCNDTSGDNVEVCNGLDDDCNGVVPADESDEDGDTYLICEGDCDDFDPSIYSGAPEVCDGLDNNCDGQLPADEADVDADGWMLCAGDCADDDAAINPDAFEDCDGIDNNCDGTIDEGCP